MIVNKLKILCRLGFHNYKLQNFCRADTYHQTLNKIYQHTYTCKKCNKTKIIITPTSII